MATRDHSELTAEHGDWKLRNLLSFYWNWKSTTRMIHCDLESSQRILVAAGNEQVTALSIDTQFPVFERRLAKHTNVSVETLASGEIVTGMMFHTMPVILNGECLAFCITLGHDSWYMTSTKLCMPVWTLVNFDSPPSQSVAKHGVIASGTQIVQTFEDCDFACMAYPPRLALFRRDGPRLIQLLTTHVEEALDALRFVFGASRIHTPDSLGITVGSVEFYDILNGHYMGVPFKGLVIPDRIILVVHNCMCRVGDPNAYFLYETQHHGEPDYDMSASLSESIPRDALYFNPYELRLVIDEAQHGNVHTRDKLAGRQLRRASYEYLLSIGKTHVTSLGDIGRNVLQSLIHSPLPITHIGRAESEPYGLANPISAGNKSGETNVDKYKYHSGQDKLLVMNAPLYSEARRRNAIVISFGGSPGHHLAGIDLRLIIVDPLTPSLLVPTQKGKVVHLALAWDADNDAHWEQLYLAIDELNTHDNVSDKLVPTEVVVIWDVRTTEAVKEVNAFNGEQVQGIQTIDSLHAHLAVNVVGHSFKTNVHKDADDSSIVSVPDAGGVIYFQAFGNIHGKETRCIWLRSNEATFRGKVYTKREYLEKVYEWNRARLSSGRRLDNAQAMRVSGLVIHPMEIASYRTEDPNEGVIALFALSNSSNPRDVYEQLVRQGNLPDVCTFGCNNVHRLLGTDLDSRVTMGAYMDNVRPNIPISQGDKYNEIPHALNLSFEAFLAQVTYDEYGEVKSTNHLSYDGFPSKSSMRPFHALYLRREVVGYLESNNTSWQNTLLSQTAFTRAISGSRRQVLGISHRASHAVRVRVGMDSQAKFGYDAVEIGNSSCHVLVRKRSGRRTNYLGVAISGHLINMMLASLCFGTSIYLYLRNLEENVAVRFQSNRTLVKANALGKQRGVMAEFGNFQNVYLWHSYYDFLLALESFEPICELLEIPISDSDLKIVPYVRSWLEHVADSNPGFRSSMSQAAASFVRESLDAPLSKYFT